VRNNLVQVVHTWAKGR